MYTNEKLAAIYKALKGIKGIEEVRLKVDLDRAKFKEQFYPTLETKQDSWVHEVAVKHLKDNGVLQDVQLLTEILN